MVDICRRNQVVRALAAFAITVGCLQGCGDGSSNNGADSGAVSSADSGTIGGDIGDQSDTQSSDPDTTVASDTNATTTDTGSTTFDTNTGAQDTSDVSSACPGAANCPCDKASDCDEGVCIETADGKKCAKGCVENCDVGFTCKKVGESDATFVCVPNYISLCSPCETHSDCNTINPGTLCLDYGAKGKFCGGICEVDSDCPADYGCETVADQDTGKTSKQCKLKTVTTAGSGGSCAADGDCGSGESCVNKTCAVVTQPLCGCSNWATVFGKSTTCTTTNDVGTCSGKRACTDKGMSPCSAPNAAEETCNSIDDDCDGVTDKLPASVTCTVASYLDEGSKTACTKDSDCAKVGEGCDNGACKTLIGACPGTPTCGSKGELLCQGAKKAISEACNGTDDDCDGAIDEDFGWAEPDTTTIIGVGKACGQGPCAGGKVACLNLIKATCTTADKATKESCDGSDNDCNGLVDDQACDDDNQCTTDTCDGKSCTNKPGATCDDKNACTADSCNATTGLCVYKFTPGSCDDGDACTVGDVCKEAPGKGAECASGATLKVCDDSNVCTDDACDKAKGCVNLANAVTQTCFGGAAGVEGVGACKGGVRYCSKGVLGTECVGQVLPSKTEACDLKDDNCNGSTDEGCDAKSAQIALSNASGEVTGGKKGRRLYVHIDGDGPSGPATGKKNTLWSGFVAWLVGATGG